LKENSESKVASSRVENDENFVNSSETLKLIASDLIFLKVAYLGLQS